MEGWKSHPPADSEPARLEVDCYSCPDMTGGHPPGGRWEQSDGNRHRLNETETKIDPKTFFWGAETCHDPEFLL